MGTTQKHHLKINPYLDIISGITVVLSFSDGIIKIIGREGSGKSVLCQLLATELMEENQEVVIFSDIPHSEAELHNPIQQQLHLQLDDNADFYSALNNHIQARPFDQQKLILVFDDADQIPDDCFEAIRILFEKNYHEKPDVSMVFAGTELLDQKLNEPANRTFNKNIILNFEVKPMNRGELEAFCNAYLVEMGLQKHQLTKDNLDQIFAETQGLPAKIPELIFAIIDEEQEGKKEAASEQPQEKRIIGKLVSLDDDPEPILTGLSVEDREDALTAFKDQVPWRWQSNGVGIAVVVLFLIVAYGFFVPVETRSDSIVIFPPPSASPGQLTPSQIASLPDTQQPRGIVEEVVTEIATQDAPQPPEASIADTSLEEPAAIEEPAADLAPVIGAIADTDPLIDEGNITATEDTAAAVVETVVEEIALNETSEPQQTTPGTETETIAEASEDPLTVVDAWLAAWQDKDLEGYFASYHPQFSPRDTSDLESWRNERSTRINRPSDIEINLESLRIINETPQQTTVSVQFTYLTPGYSDRTVKELVLAANNGEWKIQDESNISVESIPMPLASDNSLLTLEPVQAEAGESGFAAKIRQVLSLAGRDEDNPQTAPFGSFINEWLGAWKNQDVEGYFRHYHDDFRPANFDSMSDWRADRMRKIHEKRFIDIAFNDIEILDEDENTARIRFWLSYASSFYLDRTLKEVVLSRDDTGILQERNLAVEIIPFYPWSP